jgi:hypothetical protein
MNTIDLQASVNNLTQVDRHQQDQHRAPVVNQQQNAQIVREEQEQRVNAPAEPEKGDGKIIDPKAGRRDQGRQKKQKKAPRKNSPDPDPPSRTGYFVDLSA